MKWEDFGPFVLPYVVGCPLPTMVHHVRLAANEFCKRTKCCRIISAKDSNYVAICLKKIFTDSHGNFKVTFCILLSNYFKSFSFDCIKETICSVNN